MLDLSSKQSKLCETRQLALSQFKTQAKVFFKTGVLNGTKDVRDYYAICGLIADNPMPKSLIELSNRKNCGIIYLIAIDVVNSLTKRFLTGTF